MRLSLVRFLCALFLSLHHANALERLLGVGTTVATGQQALLVIDQHSGSMRSVGSSLPSSFGPVLHMALTTSDVAVLHFRYPNETSCLVLVSTADGTPSSKGPKCFDFFHVYSLDYDAQSRRLLMVAGSFGAGEGAVGVYAVDMSLSQPQIVFQFNSSSLIVGSVAFSAKLNQLFVVSDQRPQMPTLLVLNTTLWKLSVISEANLEASIATLIVNDSGENAALCGWIQNGFVRFPFLVTIDSKTGAIGPHLFSPVVGKLAVWAVDRPSVYSALTESVIGFFSLYNSGSSTLPLFVTYNVQSGLNFTKVFDSNAPFAYVTTIAINTN